MVREGPVPQLRYRLSIKWQILAFAYLGLASGLLASIDRGLFSGLLIGSAFGLVVFLLNFAISASRAPKWLLSKWAS